jgi:putative transposase
LVCLYRCVDHSPCTNIIENMMGTIRRVCCNVKRWRDAAMVLRWTAAAMQEAAKGFGD